MAYGGYGDYMNLKLKPDPEEYLITELRIEPGTAPFGRAAEAVAAESSIGTWTKISTMRGRVLSELQAKVFFADRKSGLIKVAYPKELFEDGSVANILSSVAGNIFGMKEVANLRLNDIHLPSSLLKTFKGPAFGRDGIRKYMGTNRSRRPHVGTIVKPKLGLNPKEHAQVAYEAWVGGLDLVKDDENLGSQHFCPFEERITRTLHMLDKAEAETGERKIYCANVTASAEVMVERAEFIKAHGGKCAMVDIITAGFSAVQAVRNANLGLILHGHRAMYAAFARSPRHGLAMLPLAKLSRLAGIDQLHIGAILGKMEGERSSVEVLHNSINGRMGNLKPVFSVCSGGLSPDKIPALMKILGNDIVMQMGGGCHGHPDGTLAGAKAIRQAVDAAMKKTGLNEYAKTHKELKRALEKWPVKD